MAKIRLPCSCLPLFPLRSGSHLYTYIVSHFWTMKHSVDHIVENYHLSPEASYLRPKGLTKEEMNNRTFLRSPQMKSCCQPFFFFYSKALINLKVNSSLSEGHDYSTLVQEHQGHTNLFIGLKVWAIWFNRRDVNSTP